MNSLATIPALDFSWISESEGWIALVTLSVMEIVLGIDNIVFISILVDRLPPPQQPRARLIGLALAMLTRIALLFSITWVMTLKHPVFTFGKWDVSGKDLILILGGLFLIFKSTHEIHGKVEGGDGGDGEDVGTAAPRGSGFGMILVQIALLDIVFSLDSVITAVGMVKWISVMIIAVMLAVGFMMIFSGAVSGFINRHPTIKMLALSFLLLIGTALIAEGLHKEVPKGYIYFAMAFSAMVEMLNIRAGKKRAAVQHRPAG